MSEEEIFDLLAQIAERTPKANSERAIQSLYLEFHRLVRNFVWKTVSQDATLIEEVVQDTFLEVWKRPERFRGDSKFKTWLLGIARHKALDYVRKQKHDHDPLEEFEETLESGEIGMADKIQGEQVQIALRTCLDTLSASGKLSSEHREVLHLAYIADQDLNEMAHILNCLESTIKTRLHYARLRIKNCMKKRLFGGVDHG